MAPYIPGYEVVESIYLGARTAVYRAIQTQQQQAVVIKVLRKEHPSFNELLQFRNQYSITKDLNLPGIITPLSLENLGNGCAIVMEDWGGVALNQYLEHHNLSWEAAIRIALQLGDTLYSLVPHRIVHKDIKPANILIQPDSHQVKLIDFSIASQLPKEIQANQSPNCLEGTLAYLAPEQTGRMNRGIDYRTDFYGLGVTLYELLTGTLPFSATDPLELVHCHIAKVAVPVHQVNPQVPEQVGMIVAKLMAKNAEDRYQSALGLKHDLERCLDEWQASGAITPFQLAQRDLSDHFSIPEKLYGRKPEVQKLLDAFDRVAEGQSELMLVAGFSGIGKTAVVNEVHKPILRQRGYFIKGKFDQFNRNIPLSAFVQALRNLIGQILTESDEQLAHWRSQILSAVEANGQVLIEVLPELKQVIGEQPAVDELSGTAAQNRFNRLLSKFITVFATENHPLVIFLDDLQWADAASLELIKPLMQDAKNLLILGAYRDNEVSAIHPLMLTVEELQQAGTTISTITLSALEVVEINHLIADTLSCTIDLAKPLTEMVIAKTQGNPFFLTQYLKALYEEGEISFNHTQGYWECDIARVNARSLTDNVVEFMAQQLQKLPTETQAMLKLAACMGNQFDLDTLAIVSEQSPTNAAESLWQALQEGFVLPTSQVYKFFQDANQLSDASVNPTYRFLHDRVQQAAYLLMPKADRASTHYRIGQLLLAQFSTLDQETKIFEIVNHLNIGSHLIASSDERLNLANLNFRAGRKAILVNAYDTALNYVTQGVELLPENSWNSDYSLTLELYHTCIEAAYLALQFDAMEDWGNLALKHAASTLDQIPVYETWLVAWQSQGKFEQVLEAGLRILRLLGIEFPTTPTPDNISEAYHESRQMWQGIEPHILLHLPAMQDPNALAAMQILTKLVSSAYVAAPSLLPFLIFKQVELSIQYGNCPISIVSYADYGLVLCGSIGNISEGCKFGRLSLALLERLQAMQFKSRASFVVHTFIHHRTESLHQSIKPLMEGYLSSLDHGDWEGVGLNLFGYAYSRYWAGHDLKTLADEMKIYRHAMMQAKQEAILEEFDIYLQAALNLSGQTETAHQLKGEFFDIDQFMSSLAARGNASAMYSTYLNQLFLSCLFDQNERALHYANTLEQYQSSNGSRFTVPIYYFYDAIAQIRHYPDATADQQGFILERVDDRQKKLQYWAEHAPSNHQQRVHLVAAEHARILGHREIAIDAYDLAITTAQKNGFPQEAAFANELAAKFYLDWGKERAAADYMQEAYYGYTRWGAKAKVQDLEQRYPALLKPILQQQALAVSSTETLLADVLSTHWQNDESLIDNSNSNRTLSVLDLATVLKASQVLSSEIELDKLIANLLEVLLENAGADKAILLLPRQEDWSIEAIALLNQPVQIKTIPLAESNELPHSLIHAVKRNLQPSIIIDAFTDVNLTHDQYIIKQQPKSILCTPILHQAKLTAILYLENRVAVGAFTEDRIELLNILCSQAAISLENARLYQQATIYAQELETSQLQIVQSEKMASLGNLVAGIAHEVNNPIGFLNGSVKNAQDYVKDLLEHLDLYQQYYPHPVMAIQDSVKNIDLEFLREDLPKVLDSMNGATKRIQGISTSLRTFSRSDTEHKVSANLHEGIDSTLLILKYRLKANEFRPAIEVIQDYDELSALNCFPGQLNQVFMNLIANAIDMFDEMAEGQSFRELQDNPQILTICTSQTDQEIIIRIRDNGKGMDESTQAKIFDHLFTTKAVGKGTGLGLAIARQIITEKHGGGLEVNSSIGQGTEFCINLPIDVD
jgi:predicted ATPase/signal transduction histidine kinase/tRNA A-37 threonylcarbamoyl transferase component Bud32